MSNPGQPEGWVECKHDFISIFEDGMMTRSYAGIWKNADNENHTLDVREMRVASKHMLISVTYLPHQDIYGIYLSESDPLAFGDRQSLTNLQNEIAKAFSTYGI